MFSNFDWDVIIRSLPYLFIDGMRFTVFLTAVATAGGLVLGTLLALMRLSGIAPLALLAGGYVNLMRSIPLVLVIFWIYFLVPYHRAMGDRRAAADPGRSPICPASSPSRFSRRRISARSCAPASSRFRAGRPTPQKPSA